MGPPAPVIPPTPENMQTPTSPSSKKPYESPVVRRVMRMEIVTAGSFDLFIPNG